MQTVQFSSLSAMTPRARVGGSSCSCGYCTVTAGFSIVLNVMPRPLMTPGSFGLLHQNATLKTPVSEDVEQAERDEELPRERLQLVLTQARVGEAHPEHEERDEP